MNEHNQRMKRTWVGLGLAVGMTLCIGLCLGVVVASLLDNTPNSRMIAEIETEVSEIRGLIANRSIEVFTLSSSEFYQNFGMDLDRTYIAETNILLYAFDFVPHHFDYYSFYTATSSGLDGVYFDETKEIVIISNDNRLNVYEQYVFAHEFTHALQDQHFSLDPEKGDTLLSDANLAYMSFVEGEADLVGQLFLDSGFFSDRELEKFEDIRQSQDYEFLESMPSALLNHLAFPYVFGHTFTQNLYDQGGTAALDAVWENPPVSSEQILHPEKYIAGETPTTPYLTSSRSNLGSQWKLMRRDALGEFLLREHLLQLLTPEQAYHAAAGWGGDRYALYHNETTDEFVLAHLIAWDTPEDAVEFNVAYTDYLNSLFGTDQRPPTGGGVCWQGREARCFYEHDGESLIIRAPDSMMAQKIADHIIAHSDQ